MGKAINAPSVDFNAQFKFARDDERIEQVILGVLKHLANDIAQMKLNPLGAIVVFGDFEKYGPIVPGMVQMKPRENPVTGLKMANTPEGTEFIRKYSAPPYDGAIVVNKTGQIIGAGIYLVVEDPTIDIPGDCGTRHKAAASFSRRNDVISVLTLSEETNTVRVWKDGNQVHG